MKNMLILLMMLVTCESFAVCSSPISRSNYGFGTVLSSSTLNTDLNSVYTRANELPGDCITDATITNSKLVAETVESDRIKNGTIVNADISASAAIARSKLASVNYTISSSSSTFSTNSTSATDVTNLSVSITTTGGPVEVYLVGDGSINSSALSVGRATGSEGNAFFRILRGATDVGGFTLGSFGASATPFRIYAPPGSGRILDTPAAGTYTYKVQASVSNSSESLFVNYVKLVAREL